MLRVLFLKIARPISHNLNLNLKQHVSSLKNHHKKFSFFFEKKNIFLYIGIAENQKFGFYTFYLVLIYLVFYLVISEHD